MNKPLAPNNGVFLEALGISLAESPSFPDILLRIPMKDDYLILSVLRPLKTLWRSLSDFDGHLGQNVGQNVGQNQ